MPKMFMHRQWWEDVIKSYEWTNNAKDFPHVLAPSKEETAPFLLTAPTELRAQIEQPAPIEIAATPGLVAPEVLQPVWEWAGNPPVLRMKTVGWRAWEDLQIALELERQILGPTYPDWAGSSVGQVTHSIFEADFAAMEAKLIAGLGIPKEFLGYPLLPQPEVDQLDREIFSDIDIAIETVNTTSRQLCKGKQP